MTTTVNVRVGGNYRATVVQTIDDEVNEAVEVGPNEEKSFTAPHGKRSTFEITEEQVASE